MMVIARLAMAGALIALAGSAQAAGIKPGKWQISSTVRSLDMPSVPPQVRRSMIGRTTTVSVCISPEDAARGPQDMLKANPSCTFTRQLVVGTTMTTEMVCNQGGSRMTIKSTGSFTPTSFSSTGSSKMSGPMTMSSSVTSSGKWAGACRK
jgi:hypothetical protein